MPQTAIILRLENYKINKLVLRKKIVIDAVSEVAPKCIHCGSDDLRMKTTFRRYIKHIDIGNRMSFLRLTSHKYQCNLCKKYFNQRFPGVLKSKRSSEQLRYEVSRRHLKGFTQSDLAKDFLIGNATVDRWCKDYLRRQELEKTSYPCPKILGIDEHFFTRKKGYATTFCDLKNHKIYDVVLGRSENSLSSFFKSLTGKGLVKIVSMDLSDTYRAITKKHFPNALIVADRFHVIRIINHHFMMLWKQLDPIGRKNRGLISLMRRHYFRLREDQKYKVRNYISQNYALKIVYEFKQKLAKLMTYKHQTKLKCQEELIPKFLEIIKQLKDSGFDQMKTLGATLESWAEEIARMWRFSKSNGITEGFHNKMELISRRAYGFRNFENYRLRVKALCAI